MNHANAQSDVFDYKFPIRYSQCWEDPKPLVDALQVQPTDDVVSIASGGENTLALLLENPGSLTAVDSNPAQLHLLELKIRAIENLTYDGFVKFVGARASAGRIRLYGSVRGSLTEQARQFWDQRTDYIDRGIIHIGKFERYFSLFRRFMLPLIHSKRTIEKLMRTRTCEDRRTFYDREWNNRRWRILFRLFFGRLSLAYLGRHPSCFRYVRTKSIAEQLLERTKHGLTELPLSDNCFVDYILSGEYRDLNNSHPYLKESNFEFLKSNVQHIRLVNSSLEAFVQSLGNRTVSKWNLSDVFEYMSEDAFCRTLRQIVWACRGDSKLVFWTMFVDRELPRSLGHLIRSDSLESSGVSARSRTFFYGSFNVWTVKPVVVKTEYSSSITLAGMPNP